MTTENIQSTSNRETDKATEKPIRIIILEQQVEILHNRNKELAEKADTDVAIRENARVIAELILARDEVNW